MSQVQYCLITGLQRRHKDVAFNINLNRIGKLIEIFLTQKCHGNASEIGDSLIVNNQAQFVMLLLVMF